MRVFSPQAEGKLPLHPHAHLGLDGNLLLIEALEDAPQVTVLGTDLIDACQHVAQLRDELLRQALCESLFGGGTNRRRITFRIRYASCIRGACSTGRRCRISGSEIVKQQPTGRAQFAGSGMGLVHIQYIGEHSILLGAIEQPRWHKPQLTAHGGEHRESQSGQRAHDARVRA